MKWETGERTYEPLDNIGVDDLVTCAILAKEKGLLNEAGWQRFEHIATRQGKLLQMVKQAKLHLYHCAPRGIDTQEFLSESQATCLEIRLLLTVVHYCMRSSIRDTQGFHINVFVRLSQVVW